MPRLLLLLSVGSRRHFTLGIYVVLLPPMPGVGAQGSYPTPDPPAAVSTRLLNMRLLIQMRSFQVEYDIFLVVILPATL